MPVLYKALSSASAFRGGAGRGRTGAAGPLPAGQMGPRRALLPLLLLLLRESGPGPRSRWSPCPWRSSRMAGGWGRQGAGLSPLQARRRWPRSRSRCGCRRTRRGRRRFGRHVAPGVPGMGLRRRSWSPAVEEGGYRCAGSRNGGTTGCACSLGKGRALALGV